MSIHSAQDRKRQTHLRTKFCWLVMLAMLVVLSFTMRVQGQEVEKSAALNVTITDQNGKSIKNARLEVLKWTGKYESMGASGETDADGKAFFNDLPPGAYLNLVVHANGYASTMQSFELTADEERSISVKLAPPANGWLQIISDTGQPVSDVEIQRLDFTDANGSQVVITQDTFAAMAGNTSESVGLQRSGVDGRLNLPALPTGATVTIWLLHPDWKLAKLEDLKAASKLLATPRLEKGVRVRLELQGDFDKQSQLDGQTADVLFFPMQGGSSSPETVTHTFTVEDSAVEFTAYPVSYSMLGLTMDDYFVTPGYQNSPRLPNELLELADRNFVTLPLLVHRKVKAAGTVVDANGNPMKGVYFIGLIDNQSPNVAQKPANSKKQEWASAGDAESDENGNYDIELAAGSAAIEIIHMGYFADPSFPKFEVAEDGFTRIPPVTMRPVPTITGRVLSAEGKPVSGAIVRMRSIGFGDADPVARANDDGEFELTMSRIPYAPRGTDGLQTDVFVVGLDPNSTAAGRAAVDLKDAEATSNVIVRLEPKPADWVLDPLSDQPKPEVDPEEKLRMQQFMEETAKQFPSGVPGQPVPDLLEGTWLNTSAKSMKDFRGKYVLLDFWFIGCGPCERDMPTVKMAHDAFGDLGFSVVSIHTKSQTPDNVQQFAEAKGMNYPIVVDNADGEILKKFEALGVRGFPSYILVDPDGNVLLNDDVRGPDAPILRRNKIEAIYRALKSQ